MALTSTPTPTHAAASASSALAAPRPTAKPRYAAGGDDGADFAAQLQRAQPPQPQPQPQQASNDDASHPAASHDAPAKAKDDDATDAAQPPQQNGLTALQWAQQQLAAAGAAQAGAKGDARTGLAKGIEALRKGAAAGKEDSTSALAAPAGQDPRAAAAKGGAAADPEAAFGQGFGAGNSATDTRDSLAALLPQADAALPVQAGAVGANPSASLDANAQAAQSSAPAQASLSMPPQSPAFAPALGQQIEVWMRDGVQHAEVQLNPQDLGPIRVKIAVEGGTTQVTMHADVDATRDALQQALPQLSDSLGQVGLSLTGGGVSDQSASQSQAQAAFADGGQGGGRGDATRPGASTSGDDGGALAGAAAARPAAQRRGLLDMYA